MALKSKMSAISSIFIKLSQFFLVKDVSNCFLFPLFVSIWEHTFLARMRRLKNGWPFLAPLCNTTNLLYILTLLLPVFERRVIQKDLLPLGATPTKKKPTILYNWLLLLLNQKVTICIMFFVRWILFDWRDSSLFVLH